MMKLRYGVLLACIVALVGAVGTHRAVLTPADLEARAARPR
jgi:hypothetical protein